MNQVKKF